MENKFRGKRTLGYALGSQQAPFLLSQCCVKSIMSIRADEEPSMRGWQTSVADSVSAHGLWACLLSESPICPTKVPQYEPVRQRVVP